MDLFAVLAAEVSEIRIERNTDEVSPGLCDRVSSSGLVTRRDEEVVGPARLPVMVVVVMILAVSSATGM